MAERAWQPITSGHRGRRSIAPPAPGNHGPSRAHRVALRSGCQVPDTNKDIIAAGPGGATVASAILRRTRPTRRLSNPQGERGASALAACRARGATLERGEDRGLEPCEDRARGQRSETIFEIGRWGQSGHAPIRSQRVSTFERQADRQHQPDYQE